MKDYSIFFCTAPDLRTAQKLAYHLVGNKLAACCNIVPQIQSVYMWEDRITEDEEQLLIIKSETNKFDAIEKVVKELHPYDVPELIAAPISNGTAQYLQWITTTVQSDEDE